MEIDETYIDLRIVHSIKLCMHEDLIEKGIITLDSKGVYEVAQGKQRELIDYVYLKSPKPTVELTVGD